VFEVQTDGAADAKFLVQFYRESTGGWLATDGSLAMQYHLAANALDALPGKLKTFLGLPQTASQPTTPPTKPAQKTK
jgi:hypothetical protein